MRQSLFLVLMVLGLFIGDCYSKLAIQDMWSKEHYELSAVSKKNRSQLGYVDYWVLHSFGREACEGYIERLFVRRNARNLGLGSVLFSHAISLLDLYSPSKTYLLPYPLGCKRGTRAFKTNMAKLLRFYGKLGAVPFRGNDEGKSSAFYEFDHQDTDLVALRTAQALEESDTYTTKHSQQETLVAAKVVITKTATRNVPIGELRYEIATNSGKKKLTGLAFYNKDLNKSMLGDVADLLVKELRISRASVQKFINNAIGSDEQLPSLYEFCDGRFGGDELDG